MKKKLFINLSIRLRFIFMIMLELVCVSLISWLVMDVLHISAVPNIVWIILASVTAGGVLNNFLSIRYFGPVLKLKKAMQQVAEGDFSVRLETEKQMKEIRDIYSNFNLMVQELEATEILQTDFVSNVSHEFKTPISAIEGYATLLQDDDMPISEEQEQYINKILFNTRRLSHLAGNILLLSKIEHQSIQTRQNWYRLDEQIRQSIVMMEPKWSEKEIGHDGCGVSWKRKSHLSCMGQSAFQCYQIQSLWWYDLYPDDAGRRKDSFFHISTYHHLPPHFIY